MVKLENLPEEQPRIDLDKLQDFMEVNGLEVPFISIRQETKDAQKDSVGGLIIDLWTGRDFSTMYDIDGQMKLTTPMIIEDGIVLTQKWSKIPSRYVKENLEGMGVEDTDELGEAFFNYKLKSLRTGYPRLIPVSRSDKTPETFET